MKPKTAVEAEHMRTSGEILRSVFDAVRPEIVAGITTKDIARRVDAEISSRGGEAVLRGYKGFPDVVCISVNSQVVHGIPGEYVLQDRDLVSLDLCVGYEGMITDSAFTVVVGGAESASSRVRTLLQATEQALYAGIDQVKVGARVGDISHAVQRRLLRDNLGIMEELVGHGVGHAVHEEPDVPNFGTAGSGPLLKEGMTIAIEPMAAVGGKHVYIESDGWSVTTRDHSLSAHFEHTVLVTASGYEILTQ